MTAEQRAEYRRHLEGMRSHFLGLMAILKKDEEAAAEVSKTPEREETATSFAWCENCGVIQPTFLEQLANIDTTGKFVGGDVVCRICHSVVSTIYKPAKTVERLERDAAQDDPYRP